MGEDEVRQYLSKLDMPTGPKRMHPQFLRELVDGIAGRS